MLLWIFDEDDGIGLEEVEVAFVIPNTMEFPFALQHPQTLNYEKDC